MFGVLRSEENKFQVTFMGLLNTIKRLWHTRTSDAYISWLRSQGIQIGNGCVVRHQRTARIDVSRPTLVTIGDNVDMNMNFQILTHDWASLVFRSKYHDFVNSSAHVTIGSNIYFGTNVTILKGVTIGDNCVIGAGSLVTHDIPANSVATGIPCKVVCSLETYYSKRKERGLSEAVEYVQAIRKRFGRDPYPTEMREEFIYFVNKNNVERYEAKGVPVKFQLREAYNDWLSNHQSKFENFEEFLRFVDTCKTGGVK